MKSTQRGMSLIGLLFVGGVLAFLGVIVAQAVPVMLEYQAIIKASKKAAQETTVATVRAAFDRVGTYIEATNSKAFGEYLKIEYAKWGEVVRREISTSARPEAGPMVRA